MQVVHPRCCGLDVHKKSVVACVLLTEPDGSVRRQVRTFGTMTADLLTLDDWLTEHDVTQIAMESTGVYWRPVFNLLEHEERTVTLVNAQHLKAVPGRKTDVKDSEWLAGRPLGSMLRHGLVKASFIPPAPIRELRELTRARKALVQQRADAINRVHKLLEGANIKLASVASGRPLGRSSARAGAPCSMPCSPGRPISMPSPRWPTDSCVRSARPCGRRSTAPRPTADPDRLPRRAGGAVGRRHRVAARAYAGSGRVAANDPRRQCDGCGSDHRRDRRGDGGQDSVRATSKAAGNG